MHRRDARVLQLAGQLRFLLEPPHHRRVAYQRQPQYLDGYVPVQTLVSSMRSWTVNGNDPRNAGCDDIGRVPHCRSGSRGGQATTWAKIPNTVFAEQDIGLVRGSPRAILGPRPGRRRARSPSSSATALLAGARIWMWCLKRTLLIIVPLIAVSLTPVYWAATSGSRARKAAERWSFQMLARARSTGQLLDAVGELGVVLTPGDGDWIAIRYTDSHSVPWSSAVAHTSDDRWWVSSRHFCGTLNAYRHVVQPYRDMREHADSEKLQKLLESRDFETLFAIDNSDSVDDRPCDCWNHLVFGR